MPSFFGWLRGGKKEKSNGRGASPSTSNASSTATTARTAVINREIEAAMQEVADMSVRITEIRSGLREEMNQILNEKYDRFTEERPLHVAVATFNVGEKIPRSAGDQYINWVTASAQTQADLIAVGLQEVDMSANTVVLGETSPKAEVWEQFVTSQLERLSQDDSKSESDIPSYIKIKSHSMGGLFIVVFAKESIAKYCSNIQTASVKTGQVSQVVGLRNKGAVAIRLTCFGKRILFINTHLEAHTEGIHRRNKGFDKIVSELRFESFSHRDDPVDLVWPQDTFIQLNNKPPIIESVVEQVTEDTSMQTSRISEQDLEIGSLNSHNGSSPVLTSVPMLSAATNKENNLLYEYDYLFWAGDLNYRLWNIENSVCRQMIKDKQLSSLRAKDQLAQVSLNQQAFCGFTELPLNFPPTYKYDCGEVTYDSSAKQRVPSWTDRVLYRCNTENTSQMFPPVPLNLTPESGPISFAPVGKSATGIMPYSFYSCCESSFQERVGRNLADRTASSLLNTNGSYNYVNGPSPRMLLKGRSSKTSMRTPSLSEETHGIPLCATPPGHASYPNLNEVPVASSVPEDIQANRSKEGTIVVSVNKKILKDVEFESEGSSIIVTESREGNTHGISTGMVLVALDNVFVRTVDEVALIVCSDKDYDAVFKEPANDTASALVIEPCEGGGYQLPKFKNPLFRNELIAVVESYSDHPVLLSDHRPVSAFFKIKCLDLKPKSALSLLSSSSSITVLSEDLNKLQEKVNRVVEKRSGLS